MAQVKRIGGIVAAFAFMVPLALLAGEMEIQNEWSIVAASKQVAELGVEHLVGDQETWELLWTQLAPQQERPEVDFTQSLVLIHVRDNNDPNKVRFRVRPVPADVNAAADDSQKESRSAKGIFELVGMSTRMGFQKSETSKLTLLEIPRKEVTALRVYDPVSKTRRDIPVD